ncbi:uncharacterized protein LAESUDRAFT_751099 [Laetiporus sulphureus 93-53]|uniref:DUF6533 domain-containing protein n=1 Tax=Laetiporus sulphureus 93-53 TaxID=1314785 RepID=A0A165DAW6_9APHY|nr:uncharacterized protein LAESUDRAFT_751099 [Laetiporus sulphureus 93-53]KZT04456.1 hypothetical protein LAESUDRAFT_751099 [Laetiporus sulphureus 93-53]
MRMSAEAELASAMIDYYREIDLYVAATALCCYDYGLTLPDEIQYIWKSKLSSVSALFYAFRYTAVFNVIFVVLTLSPTQNWQNDELRNSCTHRYGDECAPHDKRDTTHIFEHLRWRLSIPLANVALDSKYLTKRMQWIIGARVASLCSDAIVMIVTWMKTKSMAVYVQTLSNNSLSKVLVQDTGLYFALLSIANIIGIVLGQYTEIVDPISMVTGSLTSIVMSRLLIDLRKVVFSHHMDDSLSATLKTIAFADGRQDESLEDDLQEHDIACSSDATAADRHEDYHGDHATAEINV